MHPRQRHGGQQLGAVAGPIATARGLGRLTRASQRCARFRLERQQPSLVERLAMLARPLSRHTGSNHAGLG